VIGDIVSYQGVKWVIARQDMTSQPVGTWILWRDDLDGLRIARSAFGGWTLVKRPLFPVDMVVKWEGLPAVIREDKGDVVRISMDRELKTEHGVIEFEQIGGEVAKANLVLANLHKFERQT
jgi:hypothetical protein